MKELSTEIINIDGVDYTLFLNRKGIIAWEKYVDQQRAKIEELQDKYSKVSVDTLNDDNPFDGIEEFDDIETDMELTVKLYKRLYWIMLYQNYKLSYTQAEELIDKAIKEYGVTQIIELGSQMVEDVNTNPFEENEVKKLVALKPRKN